jgi:hypothetical protein
MAPLIELERDEHGNFRPFTADESMTIFTEWAKNYPCARFVVVVLDPDGSDGEDLGWGLALPDNVFVNLPAISITGRFRTANDLLYILRLSMDARIIWIDPEPEYWPDDGEVNM